MSTTNSKKANALLWTAQALLAVLFLLAGGMKLFAPPQMLKGPIPLPAGFLRFIGTAEVLGALGLLLPGLLRIGRGLTPVAAVGLLTIMTGATVLTAEGMGALPALFPLVVGLLTTAVAAGRWNLLSDGSR